MAKKVVGMVKLQILAGKANPAPPVGPALGQQGVNIMEFCKSFNARTQGMEAMMLPVIITVYSDRSFTFIIKTPPTPVLLKKAAGLSLSKKPGSGAKRPNKEKVGRVTMAQVRDIASKKMVDMNTLDVESAARMVAGTARSMGIEVVE